MDIENYSENKILGSFDFKVEFTYYLFLDWVLYYLHLFFC